jgi:murein L,D-transpeptidase YcbB/YkuD
VAFLFFAAAGAQVSPGKLKELLDSFPLAPYHLQYAKEVKAFYAGNGYKAAWLKQLPNNDLQLLVNYVRDASDQGLNTEDYQPDQFKIVIPVSFTLPHTEDSLAAEIKFTDAAIHFFHDVLMGNRQESLEYNGLNYSPSCFDIPLLLNTYVAAGRLSFLLNDTESKDAEYRLVKTTLNNYQKIVRAPGFKDAAVSLTKLNSANPGLCVRLYQLGFIDSDTATLNDVTMKANIIKAQKLFGLTADGVLKTATLQKLNVPLSQRIAELKYTLNTLRWLNCLRQDKHVILVNIPSATLLLYEHGKIVIGSRIIVGKKSTPTPTLCSKVTEVVLYPYWNVPYKIATQELLPAIKRNTGYIASKNFQVLNMNGRVMNPSEINWKGLSVGNFPYVIRQSTGCDNSLGLIKLNFYNPFSVYLHDTPGKSLFKKNNRYFSHGCMRLQKAMDIGHYILKGNSIAIDTLEIKGCLKNQSPIIVPASEVIPVFVLYHTAWFDEAGNLGFFEDIYNKQPGYKN